MPSSISETLKVLKHHIARMKHSLGALSADVPLFENSEMDVEKIQVPLLSVANWGGTGLHPRGNVQGYLRAASTHKWLFFITKRHDLPFYRDECIAVQRSFLDAFCKGQDSRGWLVKGPNAEGGVPAVRLVVRKPGGIKVDNEPADRALPVRSESAWPIPGTTYTLFFLSADKALSSSAPSGADATFEYELYLQMYPLSKFFD